MSHPETNRLEPWKPLTIVLDLRETARDLPYPIVNPIPKGFATRLRAGFQYVDLQLQQIMEGR